MSLRYVYVIGKISVWLFRLVNYWKVLLLLYIGTAFHYQCSFFNIEKMKYKTNSVSWRCYLKNWRFFVHTQVVLVSIQCLPVKLEQNIFLKAWSLFSMGENSLPIFSNPITITWRWHMVFRHTYFKFFFQSQHSKDPFFNIATIICKLLVIPKNMLKW